MPDADQPVETRRLKRRADFLRVAKGRRFHADAMTVQANEALQASGLARGVRIGFTLTRKVGSAVVRNRVRRRLKDAVRLSPDLPVVPGHDYVVVGREAALRLPFERLREQLHRAIVGVHARARPRRNATSPEKSSKGIAPQP
jgi:ribonuclease P protein component